MAPGKRWLWPCADSKVLRLPAYQKPSLHACLVHPDSDDHVLVYDSDDDLDDAQHSAKRRRIESIAHSFLAGQPIYISSARLKGPFPVQRDTAASQDYFLSSAVQSATHGPTASDSFIRRRHKRPSHKSITSPEPLDDLIPTLTPSRPPSSPVRSVRPAQSQHSLRTTSLATKRKLPRLDKPTSHLSAFSSPSRLRSDTALSPHPDHHGASSTEDAPPASARFRTLAQPQLERPEDKNVPKRAGDILKQRPASFLNQAEKASTASPKPPNNPNGLGAAKRRLSKKTYQVAAAADATSPFMYRKNSTLAKVTKTTVKKSHPLQSRQTGAIAQPPSSRPRLVPLDSSVDDPVQRPKASPNANQPDVPSLKRQSFLSEEPCSVTTPRPEHFPSTGPATSPTPPPQHAPDDTIPDGTPDHHESVPAIDMSFRQGSFGMDFDMIGRVTNALIHSPGADRRPVSEHSSGAPKESRALTSRSPSPTGKTLSLLHTTAVPEVAVSVEAVPAGSDNVTRAEDMVDVEVADAADVQTDDSSGTDQDEPMVDPGEDAVNEPMNETVLHGHVDGTTHDQTGNVTVRLGDESDSDPVDDFPYISTQAAMQDAHQALFDDSSPEKPQAEEVIVPFETPARVQTAPPSSPVHTITPFHQFNADLTADTQAPLPSTQALFDAYSPLKLSAKKPKLAKKASFAPSVIEEDANSGMDLTYDLEQPAIIAAGTEEQGPNNRSGPLLHTSMMLSPGESVRSGSNAPDTIPSQRNAFRNRESRELAPSQQSIRLSEIFASVSSQRGIDVNSLFSSESSNPTLGKKTQKKERKSARSSQPKKPARERKVGQRKSARLTMSQPQPEPDFESEPEAESSRILTQPDPSLAGVNRSFGQSEASGTSTIPDLSLAYNHLRQFETSASQKSLLTPARPSGTAMSSLQPAQNVFDDEIDSTIEVLQRSVLQPWNIESAMRDQTDA